MRLARWLLLFSSAVTVASGKSGERIVDGVVGEELIEEDDIPIEHVLPQHERVHPTVTPRCCTDAGPTNLLIVSTMDGKVQALDIDNDGALVWQSDLDGEPLLGGNLARTQLSHPLASEDDSFYLIPSLDGSLYMFSDEQRVLEPIPLSTEMLLQSVRIGKDAVAGGKSITTTGVDPVTGKVRYHCTSGHCEQTEEGQRPFSTLVFRRVGHSIRAVDALSGSEKWNLSVSEYDVSLVRSTEGEPDIARNNFRFLISPPKGTITAINNCGQTMWTTKLGVHIARSWHLAGNSINEVSLFDSNAHSITADTHPNAIMQPESLFYLGTINDDPFILSSDKVRGEMSRLARQSVDYVERLGRPQPGRPSSALARVTGNTFQVAEGTLDDILGRAFRKSPSNHNRERRTIEGTSEESWRVAMLTPGADPSSCSSSNSLMLIGDENIKEAAPYDNDPDGDQGWFVTRPICGPSGPGRHSGMCNVKRTWRLDEDVNPVWRLLAILLGIVLLIIGGIGGVFGFSRWRRGINAVISEVEGRLPLIPSVPVQSASAPVSPTEPQEVVDKRETVSDEARVNRSPQMSDTARRRRNTSTLSTNSCTSENFQSKFLVDFEPVKILGHGGFGVVFEAKNKLDECHYAVKRISVGNSEKAIERVLREVRAMAKLDHVGIIRYYHPWIERPPEGWQKQTDKELLETMKSKRKIPVIHKCPEPETSSSSSEDEESESLGIGAPPVQDATEELSWMDDSKRGDEEDEESEASSSSSEGEVDEIIPMKHEENSDSIVFGEVEKSGKSDKSKASGSSELSKLETNMVLTSLDEELLTHKANTNFVYLYIQMQLCQEKTLYSWLLANKGMESREGSKMRAWMRQMVAAVEYIHEQGLIHRDIKPQNIFFRSADTLKIGDLGLVTKGMEQDDGKDSRNGSSVSLHTDNVGTRTYMSPEQLANRPYTFKVDIFSLGFIFTELTIPFETTMERSKVLHGLQKGIKPEQLVGRPKEGEFIYRLTNMEPEKRPTCKDILADEFLNS